MIEETKKRDNEPDINLIRRFNRKLKMSGVLNAARKAQFTKRPLSDAKKKEDAIKRIKKEKRMAYALKLGKAIEKKKK